ncbi:hypothetical protein HMPREF0663_10184 [Hoylesella oralis ATCC 33269]|uniref:Uncharacterized protein n=2 Tax=Hoylesella oralis TaxID=28134 RepID=E7RM34_9BACT|nr:leucine zipper domain-containing protein [Hoylesella oralis]EFZ37815.1 hypothetical protein HMPREF0663_10184 [Hoylesella oralis ATCC 33269]
MSLTNVNTWLKRFKAEGMEGVRKRSEQERKPIMDCSNKDTVRHAIEQDRQSVSKTRAAWEQAKKRAAQLSNAFYPH